MRDCIIQRCQHIGWPWSWGRLYSHKWKCSKPSLRLSAVITHFISLTAVLELESKSLGTFFFSPPSPPLHLQSSHWGRDVPETRHLSQHRQLSVPETRHLSQHGQLSVPAPLFDPAVLLWWGPALLSAPALLFVLGFCSFVGSCSPISPFSFVSSCSSAVSVSPGSCYVWLRRQEHVEGGWGILRRVIWCGGGCCQ